MAILNRQMQRAGSGSGASADGPFGLYRFVCIRPCLEQDPNYVDSEAAWAKSCGTIMPR